MKEKGPNIADLDAEDILRAHRKFVSRSLLQVIGLVLLMVVPLLLMILG